MAPQANFFFFKFPGNEAKLTQDPRVFYQALQTYAVVVEGVTIEVNYLEDMMAICILSSQSQRCRLPSMSC